MEKQHTLSPLKNQEKHPFHIMDRSLLPIWTSQSVFMLILATLSYFHPNFLMALPNAWVLYSLSFFFFTWSLLAWFVQVVVESAQGYHTPAVRFGLRLGMVLFIVSEVMFFFAFFWAFFHFSLSPSVAMGCVWPPKGIQPLDIWGLPLLNTMLLLSSGATITLAHRELMNNGHLKNGYLLFQLDLFITIVLGITFLCCQWMEYKYGITFTWKENVYGTTFFVTTGFHGFHVMIGTLFLLFCLIRSFLVFFKEKNESDKQMIKERLEMTNKFSKSFTKKVIQSPLVGWKKTAYMMYAHMWYTLIVLADYIIQFPDKDVNCDDARKSMKTWTQKYMNNKTGFNLFGAIFTHTHLYMLLLLSGIHSHLLKPWYYKIVRTWPQYGFTNEHHLGFEAAAWYWHFVDVVWLFLFISMYWWGS